MESDKRTAEAASGAVEPGPPSSTTLRGRPLRRSREFHHGLLGAEGHLEPVREAHAGPVRVCRIAVPVLVPAGVPWTRVEAGRDQESFDKQFVRDYLETLDWDKTPPGPSLPESIIRQTADKYREALRRLTEISA